MSEPCFVPARILLPDPSVPLARWACLACDQFTSQPDYWADARAAAGEGPTALDLVLPEVYLEQPDVEGRIAAIHAAMERYEQQVLTRAVNGYVYLERVDSAGNLRAGLVGAVDLEQYSYAPGTRPAGIYTAGVDFPAGTYDFTATDGVGNVESSNLRSGGINDVMGTTWRIAEGYGFCEQYYQNVELPEGTTLRISGVDLLLSPSE